MGCAGPAFWRVRAAWKGEAASWHGRAHEDFRRRHKERQARQARREEQGREIAAELATIFATAAERLREIDPDFYREQIAGHEQAARDMGLAPRPVAETEEG